jgi:hypothetical protein
MSNWNEFNAARYGYGGFKPKNNGEEGVKTNLTYYESLPHYLCATYGPWATLAISESRGSGKRIRR